MDTNVLYYGDNLDVLSLHIKDDIIDLIYLDPPFNSNANYNVLFAEQDGSCAAGQVKAFEDKVSYLEEWIPTKVRKVFEVISVSEKESISIEGKKVVCHEL